MLENWSRIERGGEEGVKEGSVKWRKLLLRLA
jgi:hypothetical protein